MSIETVLERMTGEIDGERSLHIDDVRALIACARAAYRSANECTCDTDHCPACAAQNAALDQLEACK